MPTSCGCLFSWSAIASLPRGWKTAAPGPLLRAAACHHMPLTLHRQPPAPTNPPHTPPEPTSNTAQQTPPPAYDTAPNNQHTTPKHTGNDEIAAAVRHADHERATHQQEAHHPLSNTNNANIHIN